MKELYLCIALNTPPDIVLTAATPGIALLVNRDLFNTDELLEDIAKRTDFFAHDYQLVIEGGNVLDLADKAFRIICQRETSQHITNFRT